ncbi:hypothetical protein JYB64_21170 [Algoriphagus aestuarii]|nr:hypothetical protein [Algoriphagus aestuarii]
MKITDLFDLAFFNKMIEEGYVALKEHPTHPDVVIANYTKKTQGDGYWNEVTEQCRGLIYNSQTGEVIARPFRKFFNHDESHAPVLMPDQLVRAFDKMDGSLGILYCLDGEWQVATRGSFTSEQAIKATEMLKNYTFADAPDSTILVEIIYPENRVVVDYGDAEELVYLGTVDNRTGQFGYLPERWSGRAAPLLYAGRLSGLFQQSERRNAEGFVVHTEFGEMVKVKYADYVRLHRIVTKLSERAVWEHMGGPNGDVSDLVSQIPEEHADWVIEVCYALKAAYMSQDQIVKDELSYVQGLPTRKDQALYLKSRNLPLGVMAAVFRALDGKDYSEVLWKVLKPKGDEK